jgi:hypothetical protein
MSVNIFKKSSNGGGIASHHAAKFSSEFEDFQRIRVRQFAGLLNVGGTTFFTGLKSGRYPSPDGYDGTRPYWTVKTVKEFLQRSVTRSIEVNGNIVAEIAQYYRKAVRQLGSPNPSGWALGICPLHSDHQPSISVNLRHGGYKCHACGASGNSVRSFMKRLQAKHRLNMQNPTTTSLIGGVK